MSKKTQRLDVLAALTAVMISFQARANGELSHRLGNGIEAAELARAGITGPRRYLTGNKGFYRTFIRKAIGHEVRGEFAPGQPLQLLQMWLKAYCCCGANHAYIDAMASVASP